MIYVKEISNSTICFENIIQWKYIE